MATLGWIFLAIAFLVLMMVANNSWSHVWDILRGPSTNTNAPERAPGQTTGPY